MLSILLVEDVAINRMVVQQYFDKWQHISADEVTNGKEAVEMAVKKDYDPIIMDIRMPEMDGYEAVKKNPGDGWAQCQRTYPGTYG